MQLSIPMPKTPDGRVYRYSPNVDAHPRHFVMGDRVEGFAAEPDRAARMKYVPGTPGTVCPYSGTRADDAEFMHPDDRKAALKTAVAIWLALRRTKSPPPAVVSNPPD